MQESAAEEVPSLFMAGTNFAPKGRCLKEAFRVQLSDLSSPLIQISNYSYRNQTAR